MTNQTPSEQRYKYKCPMHNMWMRKGQCEICRLEADKQRREREKLTGSDRQEIKITKL